MRTKEEIEEKILAVFNAEAEMVKEKDMSGVSYFEGKLEALKWVLEKGAEYEK